MKRFRFRRPNSAPRNTWATQSAHLKYAGGWRLCSALWLLGRAQQSMETCLKVLFLGSRDSAKYSIALTTLMWVAT